MEKWSELPEDIIRVFSKIIISRNVEEYPRVRAVCKSWESCLLNSSREKPIVCSPWLMLANKENDNKISEESEEGIRSFYIPSSKKVINLKLPTQGRRCFGSCYGWLLTMGLDLNINLLNPLSQSQICLPPQPTFQHQYTVYVPPRKLCVNYMMKFAVSSNPSLWSAVPDSDQPNSVMVIYGEFSYLAIARPGDKVWTSLGGPHARSAMDIIFFSGHFYVVTYEGELLVCETGSTQPSARMIASPPHAVDSSEYRFYLVELSGDLYVVERVFTSEDSSDESDGDDGDDDDADDGDDDGDDSGGNDPCDHDDSCYGDANHSEEDIYINFYYYTQHFFLFKFDFNTMKWITVQNLGNNAIFVGNNSSFSISTSEYPDFKGNCIYFTDDHEECYTSDFCDMGIYDVSKKCVEPLYVSDSKLSKFSRPLFFMPSPL